VAASIEVVRVESARNARGHAREVRGPGLRDHAAAVADFTVIPASEKIKKDAGIPTLNFETTPDIVLDLVAARTQAQIVVAFAAETTNVVENARAKLLRKDVDLCGERRVGARAGFEHETNEVIVLGAMASANRCRTIEEAVALAILARVPHCYPRSP